MVQETKQIADKRYVASNQQVFLRQTSGFFFFFFLNKCFGFTSKRMLGMFKGSESIL